MRTILCAALLIGCGLLFLTPDASAAPTTTAMTPPVMADVPYVAYKPGWKGCDPCKPCPPTTRYPYHRPYYYRKAYSCRYPYYYRHRGCNPCGRTGFYKRR